MLNNEPTAPSSMTQVPLLTAADVQDNLLVANNDLERLAGLRDKGLITPEEYEAKKRDLLERM